MVSRSCFTFISVRRLHNNTSFIETPTYVVHLYHRHYCILMLHIFIWQIYRTSTKRKNQCKNCRTAFQGAFKRVLYGTVVDSFRHTADKQTSRCVVDGEHQTGVKAGCRFTAEHTHMNLSVGYFISLAITQTVPRARCM